MSSPSRSSTAPAGQPPLPNFLVIGAHRAATRWLRNNLGRHPDVHLEHRPVGYFADPDWTGGFRAYRSRFRRAGGHQLVGEVSPTYLRADRDPFGVAKRIDDRLPDVRLIAIVRQPVDRLYSAFRDHVIHGVLPPDADLAAMLRSGDPRVAELDLIGSSLYARNLHPYLARFGDRLLVLVTDDIRSDPAKVYRQVLDHLGAADGPEPPWLDRILYSNAASRWTASSDPTDEQRRAWYMRFRDDVEELEALLGRFLPAWDPGPAPSGWEASLAASDEWSPGSA